VLQIISAFVIRGDVPVVNFGTYGFTGLAYGYFDIMT